MGRLLDKSLIPTLAEEKALMAQGYRLIAGIDEVGRGALAGPVVAAAVILPYRIDVPWLDMVRDSKLLTPAKRELLCNCIKETAISVGIGTVSNQVIDKKGIVSATRLAMKQAVDQLSPPPESLLIDYLLLPEVAIDRSF